MPRQTLTQEEQREIKQSARVLYRILRNVVKRGGYNCSMFEEPLFEEPFTACLERALEEYYNIGRRRGTNRTAREVSGDVQNLLTSYVDRLTHGGTE